MLAQLAAAAALAVSAPVLGGPVTQGEPGPVRFLNPKTLKPIAGTPKLPRSTRSVELSPDAEQAVALAGRQLRFFRTDGGAELGRVAVPKRSYDIMWMSPTRLLVFSYPTINGADRTSTVTVVDPSTRTVAATKTFPEGFADVARAGDRLIAYFEVEQYGGVFARILDADALQLHRIDLGGAESDNIIGDTVLTSPARRAVLYKIDAATGTAERVQRRLKGTPEYEWVQFGSPASPIAVGGDWLNALDPDTLAVTKQFKPPPFDSDYYAAGRGVVVSGSKVTAKYSAAGKRLWSRREPTFEGCCAVFGRHLYLEERRGGRKVTRVVNHRTGRLVRDVGGYHDLLTTIGGRSYYERPYLGDD